MNKRWTIKELNEISDNEFFIQLVLDRRTTLTNVYSPLSEYLNKLLNRLYKMRELLNKCKKGA